MDHFPILGFSFSLKTKLTLKNKTGRAQWLFPGFLFDNPGYGLLLKSFYIKITERGYKNSKAVISRFQNTMPINAHLP